MSELKRIWFGDPDDDYISGLSFLRKIKHTYWAIIPYDWRPHSIWYRLKCFVWHRYTTVHPRTLPWHTWTDRDSLLTHSIMEILSRYIEEEVLNTLWGHLSLPSNKVINEYNEFDNELEESWYNAHKILWDAYVFWHQWKDFDPYIYVPKRTDRAFVKKENEDYYTYIPENSENTQLLMWANVCELSLRQQIKEHLKLVIDNSDYMWS